MDNQYKYKISTIIMPIIIKNLQHITDHEIVVYFILQK
jgi:hypothetical protein